MAKADVRYLTQLAPNMFEAFAVFPLDGEVVAITRMVVGARSKPTCATPASSRPTVGAA